MNGRADAFLVGGGEVLSEPLYLAFRKLGTLAEGERRFRPGAADSEGMRLGEGAAYLVVERMGDADKRGAKRYARIIGYGNAFEPPESEAAIVHASPRSVQRTIEMALDDAGLQASQIDVVCGSVSGMPVFDRAELAGIDAALGPQVAVAAPKALYGETFGASGALGVASALCWLQGAAPAPLLRGKRPAQLQHILVLAVGFYGNSSALILGA